MEPGTFARQSAVTAGPIVGTAQNGLALWADFDNDGDLDLFEQGNSGRERVFRNIGSGWFESLATSAFTNDIISSFGAAWGDFDRDGFPDLAVTRGFVDGSVFTPSQVLARNLSGTNFVRGTNAALGSIVTLGGSGTACSWADYDGDGDLDLFVGNNANGSSRDFLFRNDGTNGFARVTEGPVVNDTGFGFCSTWGDYDNDGDLDLFVGNGNGQRNFLYRNVGSGQFEKVTSGSIVQDSDPAFTASCAWGDYDNDGLLDLYVGNFGRNFLYHNDGGGTFTRVTSGAPVTDSGVTIGVAWGDYDNDGFLDLFVANGGGTGAQLSALYRNAGNTNRWLKLRLVGTVSNRSAIGAKVRVKATIRGTATWQLREVAGGHESGQDDLRPNFGLGDATAAEIVRIEWPSGIVQELNNVAANQVLNVTEPVRLAPSVVRMGDQMELKVVCWPRFVLQVEVSTDLQTWSPVADVPNVNGTLSFRDDAAGGTSRFYRIHVINGLTSGALQPAVFASNLKSPTKLLRTTQGDLLVAEAGDGPNTARVSLIDSNGQRRTVLDGLPSGIDAQGGPSGVGGLALRDRTLFVAIGEGDSLRLDASMNDESLLAHSQFDPVGRVQRRCAGSDGGLQPHARRSRHAEERIDSHADGRRRRYRRGRAADRLRGYGRQCRRHRPVLEPLRIGTRRQPSLHRRWRPE